jgi:hypothetical protein
MVGTLTTVVVLCATGESGLLASVKGTALTGRTNMLCLRPPRGDAVASLIS